MNLKNHDSSIKRLEENVNHLAQLIFTHDLTNQECAIILEPAGEKPTLKVETFAEKDDKILIILGRPMLATAHAMIDVFGKKISLERESPAVISLVGDINNFSKINEIDEPRNLEELLMSDDIDGNLGRINMVGFSRNFHVFVGGHQFLFDFIILENIDGFVEKGLTKFLFGQPFKEHVRIIEDRVKGVYWFKILDGKTIFNMPHAEERFGKLTVRQHNTMGPLLKISDEDKSRRIHHPYQKIKGFYQRCLELGGEYKQDQEVID
nr:homeodomain-like protein [Tanacetum cinerariifolium]